MDSMRRIQSIVAGAALIAACGSSPDVPSLPATVILAPRESAIADSVRVTFVKVTSDSRCPINALCVSAGEATAVFSITVRGIESTPELGVVNPARRTTEVGGIVVEFDDLQPLPFGGQPTDPKDYRARVKIAQR
jgi:hypothetical protein